MGHHTQTACLYDYCIIDTNMLIHWYISLSVRQRDVSQTLTFTVLCNIAFPPLEGGLFTPFKQDYFLLLGIDAH